MVKTSAGIAIIYKHKILLAHPTRGSWKNRFTPPKGGIEENEEIIDAAVRETFEEIGIKVDKTKLKDFVIIPYKNPRGAVYKRVYLFPLYISNLSEINLESEIVPKEQLHWLLYWHQYHNRRRNGTNGDKYIQRPLSI